MIFEEALKQLRQGKKIRHPSFDEDVYFQACYITINPLFNPEGIETFKIVKARGMSIVKMKGDYQHPDMVIGSLDKLNPDWDKKCKHGNCPQLNLFLIMADDWEVLE